MVVRHLGCPARSDLAKVILFGKKKKKLCLLIFRVENHFRHSSSGGIISVFEHNNRGQTERGSGESNFIFIVKTDPYIVQVYHRWYRQM